MSTNPTIRYLEPSSVEQGWEGTVSIGGTGFDKGSFAIFDSVQPRTTYKSSELLEVSLDRSVTGTIGTKVVRVHTAAGGFTKESAFEVRRKKG